MIKPQPHRPSLLLFRDALRAVRINRIAVESARPKETARNDPYRRKLASNVRQLFELYRDEQDPKVIERLLKDGRHDVEVLIALAKM
ncbi:hypothetical protein HDU90_004729 [Geranomyces variabilis]|nr:hypothetical protein HDU90_004729 [Geranomyces variabilis]